MILQKYTLIKTSIGNNMRIPYKYKSIEDFLITHPLNIDAELNDGWGAYFPVKGIELEATILFADISSFSSRTKEMSPIETLIFVNNYFAWMSAEGLKNSHGLVDKYIGDEMMIVYANEFGSENHFEEALRSAKVMIDRDVLNYGPHIGIASGKVVVGFTGTPYKYNCSVFGLPVAMAARCASVKPDENNKRAFSGGRIVFPAENWTGKDIDELFPPRVRNYPDGTTTTENQSWKVLQARTVPMKNLGDVSIRELQCGSFHLTQYTAVQRAKDNYQSLVERGFHRIFVSDSDSKNESVGDDDNVS